jgi:hypothetical protein
LSTRLEEEPLLSLVAVEHRSETLQELVDWDTLLVEDNADNEGRGEIVDDEVMYRLLGFRDDEEAAEKAREAANNACREQNASTMELDTAGAAILVDDCLPGEVFVVHDPNRPRMTLGIVYPNQKDFRLAVRQYAINEEFELRICKTDTTRSAYGCMVAGCPWHLLGKTQPNKSVMVLTLMSDDRLFTYTTLILFEFDKVPFLHCR